MGIFGSKLKAEDRFLHLQFLHLQPARVNPPPGSEHLSSTEHPFQYSSQSCYTTLCSSLTLIMCLHDSCQASDAAESYQKQARNRVRRSKAKSSCENLMHLAGSRDSSRSSNRSLRHAYSFTEASSFILTGTILSASVVLLTPYLHYVTDPDAAFKTFRLASYDYHVDLSHFDNSAWTWGTDYGLALVMLWLIVTFETPTDQNQLVVSRSKGMLACYMISVFTGGLAHQNYTTLESQSLLSFRILWTLCVGTVTLAPAFMGSIATELHHIDRETSGDKMQKESNPMSTIPTWFWSGFAACSTLMVAAGAMSYQRPACDICIAGVTQTPCTMYLLYMIVYRLKDFNISTFVRGVAVISFLLNAPLFPMYSLLIQYTDWSLASVNTLLHTWLLVAWTTQGIVLQQISKAIARQNK